MDTSRAYDIAELLLGVLDREKVRGEENICAVMSCLFRRLHKEAEQERKQEEAAEFGQDYYDDQ